MMNFTHFLQLETLASLRILQFYSLIKTDNYVSKPNQVRKCSSALPFLWQCKKSRFFKRLYKGVL